MRLRELIPEDFGGFIKRDIRPCAGYGVDPDCRVLSPHTEHEWNVQVTSIDKADGIWLYCPKCFAEKGGVVGVHGVICWRPRVPADVGPKPGRWEFVGTSLDDLSLVAGSSSIQLMGGCNAHFFIEKGEIRMA